jgi:hypothetical protein
MLHRKCSRHNKTGLRISSGVGAVFDLHQVNFHTRHLFIDLRSSIERIRIDAGGLGDSKSLGDAAISHGARRSSVERRKALCYIKVALQNNEIGWSRS